MIKETRLGWHRDGTKIIGLALRAEESKFNPWPLQLRDQVEGSREGA